MISVVIILYNSEKYLDKCLLSLTKFFYTDSNIIFETIFVVNDKKSYTKTIHKHFEHSKILVSDYNLGFAKGLNYAASVSKGTHILTLNPDIIVKSPILKVMYDFLENNPDVGIVGGKILNYDNSFQISSRRQFPTLNLLISRMLFRFCLFSVNKYNYSDVSNKITHSVDSVSGSCMMFSKKLFNKLNGFDERFFLYFEDTDFCYRTIENKYKVIYFPEVLIMHAKGGSTTFKS